MTHDTPPPETPWLCTQGAGRCQHPQCRPPETPAAGTRHADDYGAGLAEERRQRAAGTRSEAVQDYWLCPPPMPDGTKCFDTACRLGGCAKRRALPPSPSSAAEPAVREHTCHDMQPPFPGPCSACEIERPTTSGIMQIQRTLGLDYSTALRVQAVLNPLEQEIAATRADLARVQQERDKDAQAFQAALADASRNFLRELKESMAERDRAQERAEQARTALSICAADINIVVAWARPAEGVKTTDAHYTAAVAVLNKWAALAQQPAPVRREGDA